MDMVFKTRAGDRLSQWAHIMCDPDYKAWHSIEIFAANRDSPERATRFRSAKPVKQEFCKWTSIFPHIDVGPDM